VKLLSDLYFESEFEHQISHKNYDPKVN